MSEEQATDTLSFAQRLRDARGDVAYIEKGGENKHFKYTFLKEADVKKHVGAALAKHDLYIASVQYEAVGNVTGKEATLRCRLVISDVRPSNGDSVVFEGLGAGSDSSDKAPMKACAAALKYALTSGFLIATGDDPEDDSRDKPAARTESKREEKTESKPTAKAEKKAPSIKDLLAGVEAATSLDEITKMRATVSAAIRTKGEGAEALQTAYVAKGKALKAAEEKTA